MYGIIKGLTRILKLVMKIAALALCLDIKLFLHFSNYPMGMLKLVYYPYPGKEVSNVGQPRYGVHTDYVSRRKVDDG